MDKLDTSIDWSSPRGICRLISTTCPHSTPSSSSSSPVLAISHTTYPSPPPLPNILVYSKRANLTTSSTSGSTGNVLWDGAVYLMRFLLNSSEYSQIVRGRKVLELGSGTGFLALHLTASYACSVTSTDLPYCKPLVEGTFNANSMTDRCNFIPLDWMEYNNPKAVGDYDVVVASDCVWIESLIDAFLNTFSHYLASTSLGIISHQVRGGGGSVEKRITNHFQSQGFHVKRINWLDDSYPEPRLCVFVVKNPKVRMTKEET